MLVGTSTECAAFHMLANVNQHINMAGLAGMNPLIGPNDEKFGVRFPALSDAYDLQLRKTVHTIWNNAKQTPKRRRLHEGVYAFVAGPK